MRRRATRKSYLSPQDREEHKKLARRLTSSPITPKAKRFHFQIDSSPVQPQLPKSHMVKIETSPVTNNHVVACNRIIIPQIDIKPPTQVVKSSRKSLCFQDLFNKTPIPFHQDIFDVPLINISPPNTPPKRVLLKYPLDLDIEVTPTKSDMKASEEYKQIIGKIQSTPDTQGDLKRTPVKSSTKIDIEDSPIKWVDRRDDSHWLQDSAKKRKMRSRRSLNETLHESHDPKKPMINKLYQMLKAKIERSSTERYNYINSLGLPVDHVDPIFKAKREFRPSLEVFVTSVKSLSVPQSFLQVIILSTTAREAKDVFYALKERATLILERKICCGMGLEAGATLRLTYPMHWSRIGPAKELVISNVFWIEAIKRDDAVVTEYESLFTFDCPCQINVEACRNVPLCSSSQCDGNFPVGENS